MPHLLQPHPSTPSRAVTGIEVEAVRTAPSSLTLDYVISGAIEELLLPAPVVPARGGELWKHSCLEVFVRGAGEAYYELNFSPSELWAAYHFDGYRSAMREPVMVPPRIVRSANPISFELAVTLDLSHFDDLPADEPWRIGLSAVIEQKDGQISYWALAHPAGKPDFHHDHCFALELPAVGGA
ncbi:MAG TPA: DOMON-like domain-containing protein [Allosphingosinicella sp.]|nr:DOMON-like domain-containing protein [Allosphingosinicella sp.]